jgi:uncharacterized membrane protein
MDATKAVLLIAGFVAAFGLVEFANDWPLPASTGFAALLVAAAWPWHRRR